MPGHTWTPAQRAKFNATTNKRHERNAKRAKPTAYVNPNSHFYRFKNGQLQPVKVRRVTLLVLS